MAKITAVIDIGSNSARMVIYEKTSRFAFHMLNETKSKVRISEGAYNNGGNLQEKAMQRALDALREFLSIADSYKVKKILCVATSALRDAPNKSIFLQRVKNELGLKIKVIDGKKEALYGGIAAANLLPMQKAAITVDIGGGSTEFCVIQNKNTSYAISLDLGAVRLKELFFDKNDIEGAKAYIDAALDSLQLPIQVNTIIGIGGSFRALALALMEEENYPLEKIHAYEPDFESFEKLLKKILHAKEKELKKLHIKEERFDVIKPGALILSRIIKKLSINKLITSGVGVREGAYLADILRTSNYKLPENFNPSVRYLLDSYVKDTRHANTLEKVAKELFDLSATTLKLDEKYKPLLALAAKLYPVGSKIHYYSKHKHSYYIIQATLEYQFYHEETMLIATLTRYAKRKLPSKEHYNKYKKLLPTKETLDKLSFLLSIAVALLTHRPCKKDFQLHFQNNTLVVQKTGKNSLRLAQEAINKLNFIKEFHIVFI